MLRLSFRSISVANLVDRYLNGPHPPSPLLPDEKGEQERTLPAPLALGRGAGGEGS